MTDKLKHIFVQFANLNLFSQFCESKTKINQQRIDHQILDTNGSAWVCLGLPGSFWVHLGLSECFWVCLSLFESVWI